MFLAVVLHCPECHGQRRITSFIIDPTVIRKILVHLGLPTEPPPHVRPRAAPEMFSEYGIQLAGQGENGEASDERGQRVAAACLEDEGQAIVVEKLPVFCQVYLTHWSMIANLRTELTDCKQARNREHPESESHSESEGMVPDRAGAPNRSESAGGVLVASERRVGTGPC